MDIDVMPAKSRKLFLSSLAQLEMEAWQVRVAGRSQTPNEQTQGLSTLVCKKLEPAECMIATDPMYIRMASAVLSA